MCSFAPAGVPFFSEKYTSPAAVPTMKGRSGNGTVSAVAVGDGDGGGVAEGLAVALAIGLAEGVVPEAASCLRVPQPASSVAATSSATVGALINMNNGRTRPADRTSARLASGLLLRGHLGMEVRMEERKV